jgi:protein-S-isoprenylcysteine O-methyltransferase Ste14
MHDEVAFHSSLAWGVIVAGAVVFVTLFLVSAPYGRHRRAGWGPTISNRLGWIIMESPAALVFLAVYLVGPHAAETTPLALCTLWMAHYLNRSFIFPFRLRSAHRPLPVAVTALAITFNSINAYLNARWISALGDYHSTAWLSDPRFLLGTLLFVGGMALNIQSDNILFGLRRPGESGYRIPEGGAYRLVSAPNYLGELIEWAGWALATWSLAGLAFFVFTAANLLPRALTHHKWYRATFPDYPPSRRAVIPWLL